MNDQRRTKADLIEELQAARGRITELEGPSPPVRRGSAWLAEDEARYRLVWETATTS